MILSEEDLVSGRYSWIDNKSILDRLSYYNLLGTIDQSDRYIRIHGSLLMVLANIIPEDLNWLEAKRLSIANFSLG